MKPKTFKHCPKCGGQVKGHRRNWYYNRNHRTVAFMMDAQGIEVAYSCEPCNVAWARANTKPIT